MSTVKLSALGLSALFLVGACAAHASQEAHEGGAAPPRAAPELETGPQPLDDRPTPKADEPARTGSRLASVAGDPILASEFLAHLLHRESRLVFDTLDRLVTSRLALLEAGRLGVRLDPAMVDERLSADRARMAELLQNAGFELDRYLVEELGLDPTRYFEVLRDEVVQQLLTERVMRAWTLSQERSEVRVIVANTREEIDVAVIRLVAGEEFGDIARELSVDPSAPEGGVLPPVIRSELSPLSRLAFQTELGAWGGPVEQDGRWVLIRPESRPVPLVGDWAAVGEAVEADLAVRGVADPGYWQWRAALARRYKGDLAPLLELAGEPQRDR